MNQVPLSPETFLDASGLSGRADARLAQASDAIDGVQPRFVVEPESPEALAAVLAWSAKERMSVVLRGSGTKLGWGRRPDAVDLVVSTRRLNRVLTHQHGDLTATIEAGAVLRGANVELARHRQWLPLDASFAHATIGGTLATNDSGPLRHRHGAPRDLLIGIHLATSDGRLVKAGGNVVKNVAGYDLGKLMSGSFGSLAAIVSATFKLAPLPASSSTLVVAFHEAGAMARAAAAIGSSQLDPAAFDLHVVADAGLKPRASAVRPAYRLLIQFAATQAAVDAQIAAARRLVAADDMETMSDTAEAELWQGHRQRIWAAPGTVLRFSWLPASLPGVLALVADVGRLGAAVELVGRAGVGAGFVRVDGDSQVQIVAIEHLRARPDLVGHVVVLRADAAVKQKVDVWGPSGDLAPLLRAIKQAFDPAGLLNAGRGPI